MVMLELGYIVNIAAYDDPEVRFRIMLRHFLRRVYSRQRLCDIAYNPDWFWSPTVVVKFLGNAGVGNGIIRLRHFHALRLGETRIFQRVAYWRLGYQAVRGKVRS